MASIAFKRLTSFMIVGASGSGKTYWVYKFLRHLPDMFQDPAPEKILYCYRIYQRLFDDMKQKIPHLIFHQGLPDKEEMELIPTETSEKPIQNDQGLKICAQSCPGERRLTQTDPTKKKITQTKK